MNQFLKLTKEKLIIAFSLLVLFFIFSFLNGFIAQIIIYQKTTEDIRYLITNVFPIINLIMMILEFYLISCLSVYISEKYKK